MIDIKQMPFAEKLKNIETYQKSIQSYAISLVKDELGKERLEELQALWDKNLRPIPSEGTDEEKYNVAFENYLQTWVIAHDFMARYEGDVGKAKLMRAAINSMKKKASASSTLLAKATRSIAPKTSFQTMAKDLAYRLQVFSSFTVDQLDKNQMILTLTPCKIAASSQDFCNVACQNVIRAWLESQFNIKMVSTPEGINCTVKIMPFNS